MWTGGCIISLVPRTHLAPHHTVASHVRCGLLHAVILLLALALRRRRRLLPFPPLRAAPTPDGSANTATSILRVQPAGLSTDPHLPPLLLPCPACLVLLLRAHPPPPSPVLCILAVAPDPAWPPAPNGQPTNPTDCDQPPSLVGFSIRRRRRWRRWGLRGKDVHI